MNKLYIIGNLTRDPERRVTPSGIDVTSFTVAVNRRKREGQEQETDYFRVTAWRNLAVSCGQYLAKGRKVAVVGAVSVSTYLANDGTTRATLEVTAEDVEFLTPKNEQAAAAAAAPAYPATAAPAAAPSGYVEVDDEELPF